MRKISRKTSCAVLGCMAFILAGCASSPVAISSKAVNAEVMQKSVTKDGSLNASFKERYAKLAPGMKRTDVLSMMGIPVGASQTELSSEDMRRILYGDPKMATFEEAEKLRAHIATLCGTSIPLESSKKSMYFTSPLFMGTEVSGYRVALDLIFKCKEVDKEDRLYFAQWRGTERLDIGERSAVWTLIPGIGNVPNPANAANK